MTMYCQWPIRLIKYRIERYLFIKYFKEFILTVNTGQLPLLCDHSVTKHNHIRLTDIGHSVMNHCNCHSNDITIIIKHILNGVATVSESFCHNTGQEQSPMFQWKFSQNQNKAKSRHLLMRERGAAGRFMHYGIVPGQMYLIINQQLTFQ